MKICIVGRNSKLVSTLGLPRSIPRVSHIDLPRLDLSSFDLVYVFSWCNDTDVMKRLISLIPSEKVVFISSLAVYSLLLRDQWNRYPSAKAEIERYVIDRGGKVLRIGLTDFNKDTPGFGAIPYTPSSLIKRQLLSNCFDGKSCLDLYALSQPSKPVAFIDHMLYRLSRCLPTKI